MRFLYSIFIYLYVFGIRIAALFNPKAKKWIDGRKNIFSRLLVDVSGQKNVVWFHCSSLGELEQGRPLIEKLKSEKSGIKILLTFFSPSGFEVRKYYPGADWIYYLPADTQSNAKKFLDTIKPSAIVFVKYEFWFNFINEIHLQKIPLFLASGNFRTNQHFFKWYGNWTKKHLNFFTHIFVQAEDSEELLKSNGIKSVSVSGDTRFDRVFEISKTAKEISFAKKFAEGKLVIVAGSTWKEDEELLAKSLPRNSKLIIAPHEIDEAHLLFTEKLFSSFKTTRFSNVDEQNISESEVLIIDNIGMLSSLYQYGKIAYIGGGFGNGIHNVLEAATFGIPVIFGPNFHKFREATELIDKGGAFCVTTSESLKKTFDFLLSDKMILQIASQVSKNYVMENKGATESILKVISKFL